MKRESSLDILKIVATIMLVFCHYQQNTETTFRYFNFFGGKFYFGFLVELFFLISGYLWFYSMEYEGMMKGFRPYIIHKAIRLLPMVAISATVTQLFLGIYYLICGAQLGTVENIRGGGVSFWRIVLSALGLDVGWFTSQPFNIPTWYISVLMLCYVLAYFSTYIAKHLGILPDYFYIVVMFIGLGILEYGISLPFLNVYSGRGFNSFFFGILFAKCMKKGLFKINRKIKTSCIIGIVIVLVVMYMGLDANTYWERAYVLTFVLYPMLVVALHSTKERKWLGMLGGIAFDVYIWHYPLLVLYIVIAKILGCSTYLHTISSLIIFTGFVCGFAFFSYNQIEKPITAFLRRKYDGMIEFNNK